MLVVVIWFVFQHILGRTSLKLLPSCFCVTLSRQWLELSSPGGILLVEDFVLAVVEVWMRWLQDPTFYLPSRVSRILISVTLHQKPNYCPSVDKGARRGEGITGERLTREYIEASIWQRQRCGWETPSASHPTCPGLFRSCLRCPLT